MCDRHLGRHGLLSSDTFAGSPTEAATSAAPTEGGTTSDMSSSLGGHKKTHGVPRWKEESLSPFHILLNHGTELRISIFFSTRISCLV